MKKTTETKKQRKINIQKISSGIKKTSGNIKSNIKNPIKAKPIKATSTKAKKDTSKSQYNKLLDNETKRIQELNNKLYYQVWPTDDADIEYNLDSYNTLSLYNNIDVNKEKEIPHKKSPDALKTLINSLVIKSLRTIKDQSEIILAIKKYMGEHAYVTKFKAKYLDEVKSLNDTLNNIQRKMLNTKEITNSLTLENIVISLEDGYKFHTKLLNTVKNNIITHGKA